MSMPLISVIIPTYQHGKTIASCLDTIFVQTYPNVEVIVVNDGSTDDTDEALAPYADRIVLVNQANQGSNPARNRGFDASHGEYVIFCDADIRLRPDMLSKMQASLQLHPRAAYAYSSFRFGWKKFPSFPFDATKLKQMNYIHTTSLIRRADFPGFDETIRRFQDWDVWLTMLELGREGVYLPEELFQVIINKGRKGISAWLPSVFFKLPWSVAPWKPRRLVSYEQARSIILSKHHL